MFLYRILDKLTQKSHLCDAMDCTYNVNLTHVLYRIGYRISAYFDINISVIGKTQNLYISTPIISNVANPHILGTARNFY